MGGKKVSSPPKLLQKVRRPLAPCCWSLFSPLLSSSIRLPLSSFPRRFDTLDGFIIGGNDTA